MNKLKVLLVSSIVVAAVAAHARDQAYLSRLDLSGGNTSVTETGVALPPIGLKSFMWNNSFSQQFWVSDVRRYSAFRWAPGFIKPLNELSSFLFFMPHSWGAEDKSQQFSQDSLYSAIIANVTLKPEKDSPWNWSFGILAFDKTNRNRIFPIAGFNYTSADKTWRVNFGYPNVGVVYLGRPGAEYALYFSRESGKVLLQNGDPQFPDAKFLDENLNILGVSAKFELSTIWRLTLKAGTTFSSKFEYLNSSYDHIGVYRDHSGENFVAVSLAVDGTPPKYR